MQMLQMFTKEKEYTNIIIDGAFCTLQRIEKNDLKQLRKEFENIQNDSLIFYADVNPLVDQKYKIGDIVCVMNIDSVKAEEYWVKITKITKGIEYVKLTNKKKTIKHNPNSLPIIRVLKSITQFNSITDTYFTLFNR